MPSGNHIKRRGRPKRSLGQNFLHAQHVAHKMIAALDLSESDAVVEIGPGHGALTALLSKLAGSLAAVEKDDMLSMQLASQFSGIPSVTVVHGDALEVDIDKLVGADKLYKLVGNLPYNVASPIIRRFLTVENRPTLMIVMVQSEVADAMTASPGSMTALSVEVQLRADATRLFSVPPDAFIPKPKVDSAVVALTPHKEQIIRLDSEHRFMELVRAGFSAKRKQLHNTLKLGLGLEVSAVRKMLAIANIDGTRRPQTLSLSEWGALYRAFVDSRLDL